MGYFIHSFSINIVKQNTDILSKYVDEVEVI